MEWYWQWHTVFDLNTILLVHVHYCTVLTLRRLLITSAHSTYVWGWNQKQQVWRQWQLRTRCTHWTRVRRFSRPLRLLVTACSCYREMCVRQRVVIRRRREQLLSAPVHSVWEMFGGRRRRGQDGVHLKLATGVHLLRNRWAHTRTRRRRSGHAAVHQWLVLCVGHHYFTGNNNQNTYICKRTFDQLSPNRVECSIELQSIGSDRIG